MSPISCHRKNVISGLRGAADGAAMVEFSIVLAVLLVVIGGILDFGHAWYMRQVATNASREGARYGIVYRTDGNAARIAPKDLSPTIETYVLNTYLKKALLPTTANPKVTPGGTGYTTGDKGAPLEVTVAVTKEWFLLPAVLPGFISPTTNLQASTVMECE